MSQSYSVAKVRLFLMLALGILVLGCSSPTTVNSDAENLVTQQPSELDTQGQMLPISANALMGGEEIELEVAITPEQQAMGLMYRESLPDNQGMLFSFNPSRLVSFWMLNVKFPLDMIFLRNGEIQAIAANVPPCSARPCPTYGPDALIDQVIELRGGRAKQLGLKEGDRVIVEMKAP